MGWLRMELLAHPPFQKYLNEVSLKHKERLRVLRHAYIQIVNSMIDIVAEK
jgi:hypothetical protein